MAGDISAQLCRARRLPKATRPLTCTQFDPALQPCFALSFLPPALYQSSYLEASLSPPDPSINEMPLTGLFTHSRYKKLGKLHTEPHGGSQGQMSCSSFPALCQNCTIPSRATQSRFFHYHFYARFYRRLLYLFSILIGWEIFPCQESL